MEAVGRGTAQLREGTRIQQQTYGSGWALDRAIKGGGLWHSSTLMEPVWFKIS